ncbi:MAG: DUF6542 domain-containing protein [Nocardioidaceae bacterium]
MPATSHRVARRELSAPAVVTLSVACTVGAATLQLLLTDALGAFFGICFVLTSLTAALMVRSDGFFVVGVLPPLLLVGVLTAVAVIVPSGIDAPGLADDAGLVQRVIAGIVSQAGALVIGHAGAIAVLGLRIGSAPARPRR